jgi:anaerobic magnesium-protoporphyrin IX monomethyl ester cyclase
VRDELNGATKRSGLLRELVCLIIPPSVFLLDERVFMTLGILKVAAVLEQAGHPVEVLDLSGIENYLEVIRDHSKSSSAQVFGITATTPQMPAVAKICCEIKAIRPEAKTILGGPHVTLVNAANKREQSLGIPGRAATAFQALTELVDVLVAGDGEEAVFLALCADAPKLIDADDPRSVLFLDNTRLDQTPFPARHLVDVKSYQYSVDGVPALNLIAQLGCPFACGFCGGRESPSLRRVRMRTSANVIAELTHLYQEYGSRGFMFYDDELNVNPQMLELMNDIHQAQSDLGVEFRLRGFIKSQLFNDRQAEAMYRAGFRWILTGFESGSPRILKNINKRATKEENTRCIEIAKRHGLKVKALMSIGHPGESEETVLQTRDWLVEVQPDDFDLTIITTYPGTPYYDHARRHPSEPGVWTYTYNNDRLHGIELDYMETSDYYKGDPNGGYQSFVYTDYLSADDLVGLRNSVESTVRRTLNIPFNLGVAAVRYEHSMGHGRMPPNILRRSLNVDELATSDTVERVKLAVSVGATK